MNARHVLETAKELISHRDRWCRAALARDAEGVSIPPDWDEAASWCAQGAIGAIAPDPASDGRVYADVALRRAVPHGTPAGVNDHRGHKATLAMVDRAIAIATAATEQP